MSAKPFQHLVSNANAYFTRFCAFYERTAIFNDYDGVANGPDEGINIAKSLADKDFVILKKIMAS